MAALVVSPVMVRGASGLVQSMSGAGVPVMILP